MGLRFKWTKIGVLANEQDSTVRGVISRAFKRPYLCNGYFGLGVFQVRAPRSPLLLCMVC